MSIFSSTSSRKPKKNKFDLSHDKKLSLQMGKLIPILMQEILPGDIFNVRSEIMLRLAPMIAPVMHRVDVYTHYFFVPNRILWNEWEDFITGGPDGTSAPVHPYVLITNLTDPTVYGEKSLADYMGIPTFASTGLAAENRLNALPFRAYAQIYNDYYRDQTLEAEINFSKAGGVQPGADGLDQIRYRAWAKDYFSTSLPWAQRGPEITIPGQVIDTMRYTTGAAPGVDGAVEYEGGTGKLEEAGGQKIELFAAIEGTINELRRSVRLQEWLEKNARGGARYIEQLLSHFGTAPRDERLQRAEYLGGGRQAVTISEVLNTAGSDTVDLEPVGQMAGHGISVGSANGFKKAFQEHGFVFGIMSVVPKPAYMNGLHKLWTRWDKLDYAFPEFAQLGEQPVYNRELFFDATQNATVPTVQDGTWGYQSRYSEYKYGQPSVHGEFKTNLDFWHLARKFSALPPLNEDFVKIKPDDTKRIFAVTAPDVDDIYCQVFHNISAIRPLPYFGTPTI